MLNPDSLTWAGLLAQWMDFARSSVALPDDDEGRRWRDTVAPIINLQAVSFALGDLGRLPHEERALAGDSAELLIRNAAVELEKAWAGEPMPQVVLDTLNDARDALERAAWTGTNELVWTGPGVLTMPDFGEHACVGTLAVMQPGTLVMPSEPVAWWNDRPALELPGCDTVETLRPRQVYRQLDDRGEIQRDVVMPIEAGLPPGLPLLVPLCEGSEPVGHFVMEADDWLARQQAGLTSPMVPVVHLDTREDLDRLAPA